MHRLQIAHVADANDWSVPVVERAADQIPALGERLQDPGGRMALGEKQGGDGG